VTSLPLKNTTVIVTRPKEKATLFISYLKNLGANPIALPLIQLDTINKQQLFNTYNSTSFNWLVFTSYNAIDSFFKIIPPNSVKCKIAVVGSKTEKVLNEYGLTASFIPSSYIAEVLAKEIPILGSETVFIPQSNLSKNNLTAILEQRKAKVTTLNIYQNTAISYSKNSLKECFTPSPNFITFTSGSTVESFIRLGVELNDVTKIVCIGSETAAIAKKYALKVDAIANPHTIEGMVEAIIGVSS